MHVVYTSISDGKLLIRAEKMVSHLQSAESAATGFPSQSTFSRNNNVSKRSCSVNNLRSIWEGWRQRGL